MVVSSPPAGYGSPSPISLTEQGVLLLRQLGGQASVFPCFDCHSETDGASAGPTSCCRAVAHASGSIVPGPCLTSSSVSYIPSLVVSLRQSCAHIFMWSPAAGSYLPGSLHGTQLAEVMSITRGHAPSLLVPHSLSSRVLGFWDSFPGPSSFSLA